MPTVAVFDMTGKKTGEMELNAAVFGIEPNMTVVHAAVKNYLANQRQGTQSTLTRAEVRGKGSSRRDHRNRWPGYGRDQDQVLRWFPERS